MKQFTQKVEAWTVLIIEIHTILSLATQLKL